MHVPTTSADSRSPQTFNFLILVQIMAQKSFVSPISIFIVCSYVIALSSSLQIISTNSSDPFDEQTESSSGSLVWKKEERKLISSSEYGEISAISVYREGTDLELYNVQFVTLEPFSIFLPVVLYSDMIFYVHTGSGSLSYIIDEGRMQTKKLRQGDVFGLSSGTVFFIEAMQCLEELKIHAIFGNLEEHFCEATGPYSSFRNLLLDFDKKILQQTFNVPAEVIEEIFNTPSPPAIVSCVPGKLNKIWELEARFLKGFTRSTDGSLPLNLLSAERDFENQNGWSTTLNKKKLPDFKGLMGSKLGFFMTNLTRGSMVAPHWNPMASEIAVVLQGKGMVRVVCPSMMSNIGKEIGCKNTRFKVEEGDVFLVPRLHPTVQMSFGDDTLVFMGFSTATTKKTSHEFLVGKISIFRTLGKRVLAASLGVNDTIIQEFLGSQVGESVILGCNLCAEEELRIMEEEMEQAHNKQGRENGRNHPKSKQGKKR